MTALPGSADGLSRVSQQLMDLKKTLDAGGHDPAEYEQQQKRILEKK